MARLTDDERKLLAKAPVEWAELKVIGGQALTSLRPKKLVEVRQLTPELGRDEKTYSKTLWRLTPLGQKTLVEPTK